MCHGVRVQPAQRGALGDHTGGQVVSVTLSLIAHAHGPRHMWVEAQTLKIFPNI